MKASNKRTLYEYDSAMLFLFFLLFPTILVTGTELVNSTAKRSDTYPLANWTRVEVGLTNVTGSYTVTDSSYVRLSASGEDIWSTEDSFGFFHQQVSEEGVAFIACVENLTKIDQPFAKAGVMIRQTLGASDVHASVFVTPSRGVFFLFRSLSGNNSSSFQNSNVSVPICLRITKMGDAFAGFYSHDQTTWNPIGSPQVITFHSPYLVGLSVTSHDNSRLMAAYFSDISISSSGGVSETTISNDNQTLITTEDNSTNISHTITTTSTEDFLQAGGTPPSNKNTLITIIAVTIGALTIVIISVAVIFIVLKAKGRKNRRRREHVSSDTANNSGSSGFLQPNNSGNSVTSLTYVPIQRNDSKRIKRSWEILWDDLKVEEEIGKGGFGIVFKGSWRSQTVAIKKIIGDFTSQQQQEFLMEAEMMSILRPHENVLQFLGVCQSPIVIVTAYCAQGSLLHYMKAHTLDAKDILQILRGIAAGMHHLHTEKIVHRDLACRNILLKTNESGLVAIVSDFGFARVIDESHTGTTTSNIGPVRWMSPESVLTRQYSPKSDVWSFGVLIWEMITLKRPWEGLDNIQTVFAISSGKTLSLPDNCSQNLRDLMSDCWENDPQSRPTFEEILKRLL